VERQQKKSRPKDRVAGEKRADPKIVQHGMGKPVERQRGCGKPTERRCTLENANGRREEDKGGTE
jgi:hypothetical protein